MVTISLYSLLPASHPVAVDICPPGCVWYSCPSPMQQVVLYVPPPCCSTPDLALSTQPVAAEVPHADGRWSCSQALPPWPKSIQKVTHEHKERASHKGFSTAAPKQIVDNNLLKLCQLRQK